MSIRKSRYDKAPVTRKNNRDCYGTVVYEPIPEKNTDFWLEAEFNTFKEAKDFIDKISTSDINYYIHNENNRVLYTKEGI